MHELNGANLRLAFTFASFKGLALATVTTALGIDLAKALIVGIVSAVIGAVGTIVGATQAARVMREEARKTRSEVRDVKQKVGAARRQKDQTHE